VLTADTEVYTSSLIVFTSSYTPDSLGVAAAESRPWQSGIAWLIQANPPNRLSYAALAAVRSTTAFIIVS